MATNIDEKYADLKAKGFDLGQPTGPEQSADYGGTFRTFEHGNIYWHPVMGGSAHEVHGGILSLYLANGGPGVNPKTGVRQFGFPLSDELRTPAELTPYSIFETGAIYWTQGTGGCVMYGDIFETFRKNPGLGLPISNQYAVSSGQAIYCERGAVWTSPAIKGSALVSFLQPPLMGQPAIAVAGGTAGVNLGALIQWPTAQNNLTHLLSVVTPSVLTDVWKDRLVLVPVGGGQEVPLRPGGPFLISLTRLDATLPVILESIGPLQDRRLYDIRLRPPLGNVYNLSPHCVYAKSSWNNFGLLHATDIHLSLRNQHLRQVLSQAGMNDAAANYANCQECFRDFIHYANHLHSLGVADAVMATGDLIDYVVEPGDNPYSGNYERLRRMILGQPFDAGVPAGEELQIPIFMTFGNHDYRLNSYDLYIQLDFTIVPLFYDVKKSLDEYSTFNLTPDEAIAAQGGQKIYGDTNFSDALKMLQYDATGVAYSYFSKYFTGNRTFIVSLGANRLVMLDVAYDAGVPDVQGWQDLLKFFYDYAVDDFSTATDRALNGTIDATGLSDAAYQATKPALDQAGQNGAVIVGMHAPPFSPAGSEYPYYLRETVHPVADAKLTQEYISRNQFNSDGWSLTGTPHFKTGDVGNGRGLDNGVITEHAMDFLRLCAGAQLGVTRPIDLLLCGHHHERTEYRMRWTGSALNFFMDFYLEEPSTYYSTKNGFDLPTPSGTVPKGSRLAIQIDPTAPPAGRLTSWIVNQGPIHEVRGTISAPPYASPLDKASDAKQWWQDHRPVIAQTAALGPIDPRQRFDPRWNVTIKPPGPFVPTTTTVEAKSAPSNNSFTTVSQVMTEWPEPTFRGFRLVQVHGNVIQKVRYITLAELRSSNFKLPWEPPDIPIVSHPVPTTGVTEGSSDIPTASNPIQTIGVTEGRR